MATCALGGQAIDTAAALWSDAASPDIGALSTPAAAAALQHTLLRADAFLLALPASDPADLARHARISATYATPAGAPEKIIDGITRDLRADSGPWATDSTHAWESATLPATLALALPAPAALREIRLTFDSGFARELILTPSDFVSAKTLRGPQPETVRHYRLKTDGRAVAEETGNYLSKRIHPLAPAVAGSLARVRRS